MTRRPGDDSSPPPEIWERLGCVPSTELHGGHQSQVHLAHLAREPVVVKLVHAVRDDALLQRMEFVHRLTELHPGVVGPLVTAGGLVVAHDDWHAVCYPHVSGRRPDPADRADVNAIAATLASLHQAMARLNHLPLPAASTAVAAGVGATDQPIHGDYGIPNLIVTPAGVRVIDFDDCGGGSVAFEIGNAIYLDRFDAWTAGDADRHARFRTWFVDAYRATGGSQPDDDAIDDAVGRRMQVLAGWLTDLDTAPLGIRRADPAWHAHLRRFVDDQPSR